MTSIRSKQKLLLDQLRMLDSARIGLKREFDVLREKAHKRNSFIPLRGPHAEMRNLDYQAKLMISRNKELAEINARELDTMKKYDERVKSIIRKMNELKSSEVDEVNAINEARREKARRNKRKLLSGRGRRIQYKKGRR